MSDDKQQPRKRIRIPTPKELDEAAGGEQPEQKAPQEQKRGRFRIRRSPMRMRGGVGQNKKVFKAPRPDTKPVEREAPPDGQDLGDVESSLSEPSSEWVMRDEGNQIQEEVVPQRQIPRRIQPLKDEPGKDDKQEISSGSRVRAVKFSPDLRKKKEEPVPAVDELPKKIPTLEVQARAEARAHAQEFGHAIGDFVEKPRLNKDRVFTAICQKCGLNIDGVVMFVFKAGLVKVGGKAKNASCKGVGGYSSGTS